MPFTILSHTSDFLTLTAVSRVAYPNALLVPYHVPECYDQINNADS